jgi:DNA-binding PadR family transcriptional regulator
MLDAELAILSIIAEAPAGGRLGRDVQEVIDERNLRLWTLVGVESVFYLIEKLEQQGLIVNMDSQPPSDKRLRVYKVTQAGLGVLQTAVTDLMSTLRPFPARFELGLANLPVLNTSQTRYALQTYRSNLQSRQQAIAQQLAAHGPDLAFHVRAMFEHQLSSLQAEILWFDAWLPQWEAQAPPDPEPISSPPHTPPRMEQVILPHDPDSPHKLATRPHQSAVEFPPPPQRRSYKEQVADDPNQTRAGQPTPYKGFKGFTSKSEDEG